MYEGHGTLKAHALRDRLLDANTAEVPAIVEDMAPYRRWLDPLLHDAHGQGGEGQRPRANNCTPAWPCCRWTPRQVDYLYGRLLDAEPAGSSGDPGRPGPAQGRSCWTSLWAVVEEPGKGKESQRLRAAAALAKYDPESERWGKAGALVVNDLVSWKTRCSWATGCEAFRPVRDRLGRPLSEIFRDRQPERTAERILATNLLADYAADQPQVLADLLMDADEKQFAVIYPKFKEQGEQGLPVLTGEIDKKLPPDCHHRTRSGRSWRSGRRMRRWPCCRMNQPEKVWPLLKHSLPDPRVRSYLIHRLGPLGADAGAIIKRLDEEPDVTIRRALLLSLGEFGEQDLSPERTGPCCRSCRQCIATDADPGLHAAAEWLLRQWKQEDVAQADERGNGRRTRSSGQSDLDRHRAAWSTKRTRRRRRRSGTSTARARRWW